MDYGPQEVCVFHWFQLDWFVVEPLIPELSDGWLVLQKCFEDGKPVVHISLHEDLGREVFVPQVVGLLPPQFSCYDWNAAQCWGDLIANCGSLDLHQAHVHDSDNACVKRCLDNEWHVFEMNGFAVV